MSISAPSRRRGCDHDVDRRSETGRKHAHPLIDHRRAQLCKTEADRDTIAPCRASLRHRRHSARVRERRSQPGRDGCRTRSRGHDPHLVLGVGPKLNSLNEIAAAGGTKKAFLVDTGGGRHHAARRSAHAIKSAALTCDYHIPMSSAGPIDPGRST